MNILPLVFTFLIILSCIAFTFLREVKSIFLVETSLEGFNRTERVVNNTIVKKAYRKIKGETTSKNNSQNKNNGTGAYVSQRSAFPPREESKFNLGVLIQHQGEPTLHPLYEPLAEFLRQLYKTRLFDRQPHPEKIEYRLIGVLLKKAHDHSAAKTLVELCPDDPDLAKLFYKMLKGTNQYSRDQGIPPLGDFICIAQDKTAASLSFASPRLLEALFSPKIAGLILEEEQKKWEELGKHDYFSKEDLQALIMKNPQQAASYSSLEPYLNFSKQSMQRLLIGGDKKTGIGVERQI